MSRANVKHGLFWLSKWLAFILGCGAVLGGEAQAHKSQIQPVEGVGPSDRLDPTFDEVLIRFEGEKIYLSEGGSLFKELSLVDAPVVTYFRALVKDAATVDGEIAVPVGPIIVANGGPSVNGAKPKGTNKKKMEHKETPTKSPPTGK
jgi:hypothetical protein